MSFRSTMRRALLPAVAATALALTGSAGAAPKDQTVATPANATNTYYYLDPANPLPRKVDAPRPAHETDTDVILPAGKRDKNNHLPVKPKQGSKPKSGTYRLTPIPF